jgi:hypothetical protein
MIMNSTFLNFWPDSPSHQMLLGNDKKSKTYGK